jgi:hypothetical protein
MSYKKVNKLKRDEELHIGGVSGSFYVDFKIIVRRSSDDAVITIDTNKDKLWKKRLEVFCEGTDGYLCNYR